MKRAVEAASGTGLKWTEGDNVTDLDCVNDILIDETAKQLQKVTNSVASCAKEIGLDINVRKTKCMKIDPCTGSYVATEGKQIAG